MKATLKIASLFVALFCATISVQAQKFGYVNSNEIMAEMPDVKQADSQLEALQKQLQKKGQSMVEEFQKSYQTVQQKVQQGELSPKQQEEEAAKLEEKQAEIQSFEQDMMNQIQQKRAELMEPILEKVNAAIQKVAKDNGYQFIFDEQVLLYKEDSQNVTPLVKAELGITTP